MHAVVIVMALCATLFRDFWFALLTGGPLFLGVVVIGVFLLGVFLGSSLKRWRWLIERRGYFSWLELEPLQNLP